MPNQAAPRQESQTRSPRIRDEVQTKNLRRPISFEQQQLGECRQQRWRAFGQAHHTNVGTVADRHRDKQRAPIGAGAQPIPSAEPFRVQAAFRLLAPGLDPHQRGATGGGRAEVTNRAVAGQGPGPVPPTAGSVITDLLHAVRGQPGVHRPQSSGRQPREQDPSAAAVEPGLRHAIDAGQPAPRLNAAIEQAQPGLLLVIAFDHQQLIGRCSVQRLQGLLRRHGQWLQAFITRRDLVDHRAPMLVAPHHQQSPAVG